jgi:putative addiction module killer protein
LTAHSFIDEDWVVYEIVHFLTTDQKDVFEEWIVRLRDRKAISAIDRRVWRMENGNFGDHKFCRDGVWELRIDVGPGYRVYYALSGQQIILLLCGGDKRTQSADIGRACRYWDEWQRRSNER